MKKKKTVHPIKVGDRVIVLLHARERRNPRPDAMRGTVVAVGRPQVKYGGGIANVTVRWDNGHTGRQQDFSLAVSTDEEPSTPPAEQAFNRTIK